MAPVTGTDNRSWGPTVIERSVSTSPTVASVVVTAWVVPSCLMETSLGVRSAMSVGVSGSRRERERSRG